MHHHWRILATLSAAALLASAGPRLSGAGEEPQPSPTTSSRNPLRDSREGSHSKLRPNADAAPRPDLLRRLQADLEGTDPSRAIVAVHKLRDCGAAGANILAQLLAKPNQTMEIQFSTLRSLGEMGDTAVPAVVGLIQQSQDTGRHFAWQILEGMGPQAGSATPALREILRNAGADVDDRMWAANVLGQIGRGAGAACSDLLQIAEQEQDLSLRVHCLQALSQIGRVSPAHQSRLVSLLLNEQEGSSLRVAAAAALVEQPTPPHVVLPALIGLARDTSDGESCLAAIRALGKLGPKAADAVPALIQLLDHEWSDVRLAAIEACGAIGSPANDAVTPLVRRIQIDDEESVSMSAGTAIVKIDPQAVPALLPGLIAPGETPQRTLRALLAMGPAAQAAVPQLLTLLADPHRSDLHPGIVRVLGGIGSQARGAVAPLKSLLASPIAPVRIRVEAARALGAIGPDAAAELVEALRDREPAVRVAAARALGLQDARERNAIPALLRELANGEVAEAAMEALAAIGNRAVPQLEALLGDPQAPLEQRGNACLVLARIGDESGPILVRVLQHQDEDLANAAEQALFELGPKAAVPALLNAVQSLEVAGPSPLPAEQRELRVGRMLRLIGDLSGGLGGAAGGMAIGDMVFDGEAVGGGAAAPLPTVEIPPADAPAAPVPSAPAFAPMAPPVSMTPALPPPPPIPSFQPSPPISAGPKNAPRIPRTGSPVFSPMEDAQPPVPPDAVTAVPTKDRMIEPKSGVSAGGAAETSHAYRTEPVAAAPPAPPELKIVKVFYGTNRQPLETAAEYKQFLWRGFLPAAVAGSVTVLLCGIGFARSRSRWQAAAAIVGVIATLCLAYPASQQSSNSARSISDRTGPVYGCEPSDRLHLGLCEVSLPPDHHSGELETPSILKLEFSQDPRKHVVLRGVAACDEDEFHQALQQNLRQKGNSILVFIHGYNVDFDNAARRTAQLAVDLEFPGVPLFFSWPSQGNWYEYRQDEKQVELAVPQLKQFLLNVATRSQATSMHLIAHSMGNRALTAALKEMESDVGSSTTHFNQVVLAAPDIDADVFRDRIAPAIINQAQRVTMYASSNDLALTASRTFNSGDLRAGDTSRGLIVTPGIETIDVSAVDTSLLGHSYYGDNPTVLTDLKELLKSAHSADERPFLEPIDIEQRRYWVFHHPSLAARSPSEPQTR